MLDDVKPSSNLEAEQRVLACCLLDRASLDKVRLVLRAADYYQETHRVIHQALCDFMDSSGMSEPDLFLFLDHLERGHRLEAAGGRDGISDIVEHVGSFTHAEHYAALVRKCSLERLVFNQLQLTARESTPENVTKLGEHIMDLAGVRGGAILDFGKDLECSVEALLSARAPGINTGFEDLDRHLCGLEPGDLMTIGARTGIGKTAMMTAMALNMARMKVPVLYITSEMTSGQMLFRILPGAVEVPFWKFRRRMLNEAERGRVMNVALPKLKALPIKIFARTRPSLDDIRGAAARSGCGVIMLDYLQRCKLPKAESRAYEVAEFMVELKSFCQQAKIRCIMGCQLDRGLDKTKATQPTLSDLRDSGAIEHESDQVILLWKPAVKEGHWDEGKYGVSPSPGSIGIEGFIAKNRHGESGASAHLELNGELVKLVERGLHDEPMDGDSDAGYDGGGDAVGRGIDDPGGGNDTPGPQGPEPQPELTMPTDGKWWEAP